MLGFQIPKHDFWVVWNPLDEPDVSWISNGLSKCTDLYISEIEVRNRFPTPRFISLYFGIAGLSNIETKFQQPFYKL